MVTRTPEETLLEATGNDRAARRFPDLSERLKQARTAQALSLRELAGRIGVSASLISQIETGKVQPSVSTLYALASELNVSIDSLMLDEPPTEAWGNPAVLRSEDRTILQLGSGVRWERLAPAGDPDAEFFYLVYEPGSESTPADAPHHHAGREWGYIISGTLHLDIGDETHKLGSGDSVMFESSVPHRLHNPGSEPASGVWFVLGRRPPRSDLVE
jgi:transcriptional regulator with XRE-family HTH domain